MHLITCESGNRNVVAIVTGTVARAVFVALLVLGAMQRNTWLGGIVYADKGIGISFGVLVKRGKKK